MAPPPLGFGKLLAAPLLVLSFLLSLLSTVVVLGLAASEIDKLINRLNGTGSTSSALDRFEGNAASFFVIAVALIAEVAAVGSHVVGLHHLRVWTTPSLAAAQAAAWIAFGLRTLPFALVWKEFFLGGDLGINTRITALFVVLVTVIHLFYTITLYVPRDVPER